MTDRKQPAFRLKFRDKNKQTYDVGTAWRGRFPESFDVSPQMTTEDGRFPKMALSEALERVANKDGWLSLVDATPRERRDEGGGYGKRDESSDDLPF